MYEDEVRMMRQKKRISGWTDIKISTPELYPSPSKILYSPGQTLFIQWDKTSFVKICHILPGRVLIYEAQITSLAFVVGIFIMQLFTRSLMMRGMGIKKFVYDIAILQYMII